MKTTTLKELFEEMRAVARGDLFPPADAAQRSKEPDVVGIAMETLLTKRQIAAVKSRTFLGPSRRSWVRHIFDIGLDRLSAQERAQRETEDSLQPPDLTQTPHAGRQPPPRPTRR